MSGNDHISAAELLLSVLRTVERFSKVNCAAQQSNSSYDEVTQLVWCRADERDAGMRDSRS